jgi:plastocyanin
MPMKPVILVALFVLACPSAIFSAGTLILARGEQVVFLNDDTVPHNIMSETLGNAFDLGSQAPGSSTPVSFDNAGDVMVLCAIHPRMQMTITIKD